MLWETLATLSAGLGSAGVALLIRKIWKAAPRILVPLLAGASMLLFQIVREYMWFAEQKALLPARATVVAQVPYRVWYRPWSYVRAPVLQFAVLERAERGLGMLYVFTRHQPIQTQAVHVDCMQLPELSNVPRAEERALMMQVLCH